MSFFVRLTVFFYRLTGGKVGGRFRGSPVLLLTSTGRKSGKLRTTPVLFVHDGENLVVVASNGGKDKDPSWWLNLKHNPTAQVEIRNEKRSVRAEKALGQDKNRLWLIVTKMYPSYEDYQRRTKREIPVVILRPAE
ncbi:MAG: nitroreductase family deazaflavin-dependent oxidoreductase [Nitrososphaerales archaeon]